MHQILAYIKFLFQSINQNGVHSVFIENLITKCLHDKSKHPEYDELTQYRDILKSSKVTLEIIDQGEGSKVLDSKTRAVSKMVNTSSSSKREAELLYRITKFFHFNSILELGTSLGVGTHAFALGNPNANITTIEGCPNTSDFSKSQLSQNIIFLKGDFATVIPTLKETSLDCIYFDGHHNKKATINYFEMLLPKTHNDSVFIFDDIYWSKGMTEAWQYIKTHNAVTVTIDCFNLGFVFFRKKEAKQHFKIRL